MNNYEEKRAARIERLRARAERLKRESNRVSGVASDMASVIPFGQPILVGHHSEKRDRNYRGRIGRAMDRAVRMSKEAEAMERRADAAESNQSISSDDPDAVVKLKEKLSKLEAEQARDKEINKLVRKNDRAGLEKLLGWNDVQVARFFEKDFAGRIGIPSYVSTNRGAEIRRLKKRIDDLVKNAARVPSEKQIGDVRIVENVEDNRLQIFFPGKPSDAVRSELKSSGFRWAPSVGAWQRNLSSSAVYYAERIVAKSAVSV